MYKSLFFILVSICGFSTSAGALTDPQRREFLAAYSPLIFKEANEHKPLYYGHDWILNFYFDGDRNFSNNSKNIFNLLSTIKSRPPLHLNPTVYTYLLEFSEDQRKSLILVYNIYHARDAQSIHDWERFEIRLDNVGTNPLETETVAYGVITNHGTHVALAGEELQFFKTASGKHPLIFQAKWSNPAWGLGTFRKNELHFVDDTIEKILASNSAAVKVRAEKKPVPYHYLYIVGSDVAGVSQLNAQILTAESAAQLYAGVANRQIKLNQVKRLQYELQDMADILPSHLEPLSKNWEDGYPILLDESPILTPQKSIVVATNSSLYEFYSSARSERATDNSRSGYPKKHWFWGAYAFNGSGFTAKALNQPERNLANIKPTELIFNGKPTRYFWQHDYFAHDKDGQGHWLNYGWHTEARGGFDGRWSQLFEDQ